MQVWPSLQTHLIPPSRQGSGQSGQSSHRMHCSSGLHCLHMFSLFSQSTSSGKLQTGPYGYLIEISKNRVPSGVFARAHSWRQSDRSGLHTQNLLQSENIWNNLFSFYFLFIYFYLCLNILYFIFLFLSKIYLSFKIWKKQRLILALQLFFLIYIYSLFVW